MTAFDSLPSSTSVLFLNEADVAARFQSLIADTDTFMRGLKAPQTSNLAFQVDGIPFESHYVPEGPYLRLVIWGPLGVLPYTVSSSEKRRALITILEGSRRLPHIKFGIDRTLRILVSGEFLIPPPHGPTFIFAPLIAFLQEAQPYIRLIGETL